VTSELDIYRVAQLLIEHHGADHAEDHAQGRADALLSEGDTPGCVIWLGIAEAIKVLLAEKPEGTVH
jgi:hypothetical protein